MTLKEIKEAMQAAANQTAGINGFSFDDMSAALTNQNNDYPLLHITVPTSTQVRRDREDYNIKAFLFVLEKDANVDERMDKWDDAKKLINLWRKKLIELNKPKLDLTNQTIIFTAGHPQGNDALVGMKAEFTLTTLIPLCDAT